MVVKKMDTLMTRFYKHYPHLKHNKAVDSFISKQENRTLIEQFLLEPNAEREYELNEAFKSHYFDIRFTAYVSSSLYFHSVNFDKKHRTYSERHPLTLDKKTDQGDGQAFIDLVPDQSDSLSPFMNYSTLAECLEDDDLLTGYRALTERQQRILDLAYVQEWSDTEIARSMGVSQQAISKSHKKALNALRILLQKKE